MSHDCHESAPNYSPNQILFDGCKECQYRSNYPAVAIGYMSTEEFVRAWKRAADMERLGLSDISYTEAPLMHVLWAIQIQLSALGFQIGEVPQNEAT